MASALNWLRNKNAELDVNDEVSVTMSLASFKTIYSLMPKSGDKDARPDMTSALAWLRSKTDVDDETGNLFKKFDGVLQKIGLRSSIQESGFSGALDWLRPHQASKAGGMQKGKDGGRMGDQDFAHLLPKSEKEEHAQQMASALDWLKNKDLGYCAFEDMLILSLGWFRGFFPQNKIENMPQVPGASGATSSSEQALSRRRG